MAVGFLCGGEEQRQESDLAHDDGQGLLSAEEHPRRLVGDDRGVDLAMLWGALQSALSGQFIETTGIELSEGPLYQRAQ